MDIILRRLAFLHIICICMYVFWVGGCEAWNIDGYWRVRGLVGSLSATPKCLTYMFPPY
jgi:hypothetical protein